MGKHVVGQTSEILPGERRIATGTRGTDIRAPPRAAPHQAACFEFAVRGDRRGAADTELIRQRALGWEAVTGHETPVADSCRECFLQLAVERRRVGWIQTDL